MVRTLQRDGVENGLGTGEDLPSFPLPFRLAMKLGLNRQLVLGQNASLAWPIGFGDLQSTASSKRMRLGFESRPPRTRVALPEPHPCFGRAHG